MLEQERFGPAVAALAGIAARLRAPDGCPWDREQTHASLRPNLLEEAYEALEAIDTGDPAALRDELGDLLFQVVIHAQLAREAGAFDLADVAERIADKLVRRHPHVFAGTSVAKEDLLAQWERIKREEQEAIDREHARRGPRSGAPADTGTGSVSDQAPRSILDGIPASLPALFLAERLQERAARVRLDPEPRAKVEFDGATALGELFFDLVALARVRGIDAETALREANERFAARVRRVEERARSQGRALESYSAAEMRRLWDESAIEMRQGPRA